MTQFSLSPAFVKLHYTFNTRMHIMTLPVLPYATPTPGSEPVVKDRGENPQDFEDAIDAFVTAHKPAFASTTTFGLAQFWYQPTPASTPQWIYEYTVGIAGTNAGSNISMLQTTLTYRTLGAHILKTYLMESCGEYNSRDYSPWGSIWTAIGAYMIGSTGFVVGRDGEYPIATLAVTTKINDALRKKYLLDT